MSVAGLVSDRRVVSRVLSKTRGLVAGVGLTAILATHSGPGHRLAAAPAATALRLEALVSAAPIDAPMSERVARISAAFLGAPHVLDPAGEGADAPIDRDPEMPLDRMDCQTLVETVLALARARRPDEVWPELRAIRYRHGMLSFELRHHFPEVDWFPANVARGVVADVSSEVAAEHGTATASARITRQDWLRSLVRNPTQARNDHLRSSRAAQAELERLAAAATDVTGTIRYVAKGALARADVLARIPDGAVVLIVRPETSMFGRVGSVQNVSHMGFAVRTPQGLVYRHASSTRRRAVVDRPLAGYLEAMNRTKTFAGIAVYAVLARQPTADSAERVGSQR